MELDRLVQLVPTGQVMCNTPGCTAHARLVVLWRGPGDGSMVMAVADHRLHAEGVCVAHALTLAEHLATGLREVRRADAEEAHVKGAGAGHEQA